MMSMRAEKYQRSSATEEGEYWRARTLIQIRNILLWLTRASRCLIGTRFYSRNVPDMVVVPIVGWFGLQERCTADNGVWQTRADVRNPPSLILQEDTAAQKFRFSMSGNVGKIPPTM